MPLPFQVWCEELMDHLIDTHVGDVTEWTVFLLRKYQEYLSTFD